MANIYPTSIRAYATIKFKEPIPKDTGIVYTWESFCIKVGNEKINIDFEETEICVDNNDRRIVEVMWKNPDYETFSEEFNKLTLNVLKNAKITLNDDLSTCVCASKNYEHDNDDEDNIIKIDTVLNMMLLSPYDEFENVELCNNKN